MNAEARAPRIKGIVHCHTNLSYDSTVPLAELCSALRRRGFSFVALTEHAQGVSGDSYETFVDQCNRASDQSFVVIPGLEFLCDDGIELAGIGVSKPVTAWSPQEVVDQIRGSGGYAVWLHPMKRAAWDGPLLDCDAVEVLNGKVDGAVVPNLGLLQKVRNELRKGRSLHVIFGRDLHQLEEPGEVWVECEVGSLTRDAILKALRHGRFYNRTKYAAVSSWGQSRPINRLVVLGLRSAYVAWNWVLARLPEPARHALVRSSRPLVRVIKGNPGKVADDGWVDREQE